MEIHLSLFEFGAIAGAVAALGLWLAIRLWRQDEPHERSGREDRMIARSALRGTRETCS